MAISLGVYPIFRHTQIDGPFTELKNGWIFPWQTLSRVEPLSHRATELPTQWDHPTDNDVVTGSITDVSNGMESWR